MVTRRTFLRLSALAAGGAFLSACGPLAERITNQPGALDGLGPVDPALFAALNRLTYGPRPEELARATEIGLAGWIEEQLAPSRLDDTIAEIGAARCRKRCGWARELWRLAGWLAVLSWRS